jgi:hypothetical protein
MRAHSSGRVTSFVAGKDGVRWRKILHLTGNDVSEAVRTTLALDISMSKNLQNLEPVVLTVCATLSKEFIIMHGNCFVLLCLLTQLYITDSKKL